MLQNTASLSSLLLIFYDSHFLICQILLLYSVTSDFDERKPAARIFEK